jgi:hypothetical protein
MSKILLIATSLLSAVVAESNGYEGLRKGVLSSNASTTDSRNTTNLGLCGYEATCRYINLTELYQCNMFIIYVILLKMY